MADRGRRFRERPMDYAKPMPVVKNQRELYMTDDGQLMPKKRDDEDNMESCLSVLEEDEDVSFRRDPLSLSLSLSLPVCVCDLSVWLGLRCSDGLSVTAMLCVRAGLGDHPHSAGAVREGVEEGEHSRASHHDSRRL